MIIIFNNDNKLERAGCVDTYGWVYDTVIIKVGKIFPTESHYYIKLH